MTKVIQYNRNLYKHITYAMNVNFTTHSGILSLDKEIELRYTDGHRPDTKFSSLRQKYMELVNPVTNKPLVEAVIPCPEDPGTVL